MSGKTPALTGQVAYMQAEGNAADSRSISTATVNGNVTYDEGRLEVLSNLEAAAITCRSTI